MAKKTEVLLSNPAVTYNLLYNNFFYARLLFVFDLQEDFNCIHDNIDAFFFLLQKNFNTFHRPYFDIYLCLFVIFR